MKLGLFLAATMALLPMTSTEERQESEAAHARARTTVFDVFDLSPEQFATLMSKSDD
jgi:hypothetical protein